MENNTVERKEVILAGIGGGGILTAGLLLGRVASAYYKNVICFPTYDISKRGGRIECTVIFSNEEIASPIVDQVSNVVVADPKQIPDYEGRVCHGGTLFVESSGFSGEIKRDDITIIKVPAIKTSIDISGDSRSAINVFLGILTSSKNILSTDSIEQELQNTFSGKENILKINLEAFRQGVSLSRNI
jgi:2-oxoglutarate ferredoxin oxidoreductase subunit gamma